MNVERESPLKCSFGVGIGICDGELAFSWHCARCHGGEQDPIRHAIRPAALLTQLCNYSLNSLSFFRFSPEKLQYLKSFNSHSPLASVAHSLNEFHFDATPRAVSRFASSRLLFETRTFEYQFITFPFSFSFS